MVYTLVLWGFLYGVNSHGTQGTGGVGVVTFNYADQKACDTALAAAQKAGQVGTDPFANYQIVGECVAHPGVANRGK